MHSTLFTCALHLAMAASIKNLLILATYFAFTRMNKPSHDFTDDVANHMGHRHCLADNRLASVQPADTALSPP